MIFIGWALGFLTAVFVYAGIVASGFFKVFSWIVVAILVVVMWLMAMGTRRRGRY